MSLLWIYLGVLVALLIGLGVGMFFYLRSMKRTESFEPAPIDTQIAAAFRTALNREPSTEELLKVTEAASGGGIKTDEETKLLDHAELQAFVQANFVNKEGATAAVDTAFLSFEKALDAATEATTAENKQALALAFSTLLCLCIQTQTVRDFHRYMEEKYQGRMALVMHSARENPDVMQKCNRGNINALDTKALDIGEGCSLFCGTNFESAYSVLDKAEVDGCVGKCALLSKVQSAVPALPATNNLSSMLSTADAPLVATGTDSGGGGVSYDRPDCSNTKLYDAQKQRKMDDLQTACARSTKYINADDLGKLLPDQKWSVPQTRPPACLTDSPCDVQPVVIAPSTGLQGTPYVTAA